MSKQQHFEFNKIYIKDLSLETPNTPHIFQKVAEAWNNDKSWQPEISLQIANEVEQLAEEGLVEVALTLTVTAMIGGETAYVIEVEQAGIFTVVGFEPQNVGYLQGAVIPNILFPFAREVIASLSQKAGFPPLLLNPIDFNEIYHQHTQQHHNHEHHNHEHHNHDESDGSNNT